MNPTNPRLAALVVLFAVCWLGGCNRSDDTVQPSTKSPATTASTDDTAAKPKSFEICFKAMGQRIPVIMYHDIVKRRGAGTVWFDSTADEFSDQMKLLEDKGYQAISLDDLHKHLTEGAELPPKSIVLTFDDNYQGFYDYAWPILKRLNFPAAIFVHTGYVGTKTGREHMSWDTLKELTASPLITIGSHTVTHPDLTKIDSTEQTKELTDSKNDLEQHLGKQIDYFAYPDGKNDQNVQILAKQVGYTMSFSIENGPSEESPGIECVNRYIQTRLEKALDECDQHEEGSAGIYYGPIKDGPVAYKEQVVDGKTLALVEGGRPMSVTSATREGVLDFIHRTKSAAGINGTFFNMAAISSTDNKLVGPCRADGAALIPDEERWRWPKLANRPLVVWGPTKAAIVPYNPARMNDEAGFDDFMPDYTDAFLGGAWLVHDGVARTKDQLLMFSSKDVEDPRRRAAFGFLADGTAVAAASKDSVPSSQFATMLTEAGVQEAVLLDSGFSTSLVYGEKIMASGHSTPTMPSRPVPHAIVFQGTLDPDSQAAATAAIPATDPMAMPDATHHRRRRRRRAAPVDGPPNTSPPDTSPPDTSPPSGGPPDTKPPDTKPPGGGN